MAKSATQTRSLEQINAEIARLQKEAEAVRAAEVADVIAKIKSAIAHYGLTAQDLGLAGRRGRPAGAGGKRAAGIVKYADQHGNTWTGRGTRPRWYREALASGLSPEDLLVK